MLVSYFPHVHPSSQPSLKYPSRALLLHSARSAYLVPLSHAIVVLVQSLPVRHVVLAVEAGEVHPAQRLGIGSRASWNESVGIVSV